MIQWVYHLAIGMFELSVRIASLFHPKARLAISGRKKLLQQIEAWRKEHAGKLLWFHCASLGEFEQGRALIEKIRAQNPEHRLLLTFFSPSGYEIRKNYNQVDGVFYLPFDHLSKMRQLVKVIHPDAVCIVKYEYWVNWFKALSESDVPIYLVSAKLRPGQRFFGLMGWWWQKTLHRVRHFFVQDQQTEQLLHSKGIHATTLTGDTRFDRVYTIRQQASSLDTIKTWCGQSPVLVVGSAWQPEVDVAIAIGQKHPEWKIIIVPHDVDQEVMQRMAREIQGTVLYSALQQSGVESNILLVNTTGILSSIYQYAQVVVIGGGFGKGIHNTLEAATWGKYILFGPKYHKFAEAIDLIDSGAAMSCANVLEMEIQVKSAMKDPQKCEIPGLKGFEYVEQSLGATQKILQHAEIQSLLKK
jgi:3-deoxy-D-manno-octulosonic-acid transferase